MEGRGAGAWMTRSITLESMGGEGGGMVGRGEGVMGVEVGQGEGEGGMVVEVVEGGGVGEAEAEAVAWGGRHLWR